MDYNFVRNYVYKNSIVELSDGRIMTVMGFDIEYFSAKVFNPYNIHTYEVFEIDYADIAYIIEMVGHPQEYPVSLEMIKLRHNTEDTVSCRIFRDAIAAQEWRKGFRGLLFSITEVLRHSDEDRSEQATLISFENKDRQYGFNIK